MAASHSRSPPADNDVPAPSENTPLLCPAGPSRNTSYATSRHDRSDSSSITTVEDDDDELLSLLVRATSNVGIGMEAEVLPGIANTPDEHGDFKLPRDKALEVRNSKVDGDLGNPKTREFGQLVGVTKGQFWVIFAAVLFGNFIGAFDSTIMASTHTSITSHFHASKLASWLSTSFLLTSTSFQPLFGRVSDVTGRKMPFVVSALIFTLATVWCALAQSIESFIAARAVCGLGAGGMLTMGSIVLSDMVPIEIRATYQSINNLAWGVGSALGAALGGFLADALGWRWEFGIQVPFGVFVAIVGLLVIPSTHFTQKKQGEHMTLWERFEDFDWAGSVFLTSTIATLILGLSLGGNIFPWSDYRVWCTLILSAILAVFFYHAEIRAKSPVMPLDLVFQRPFSNGMFSGFFAMLTVNSIYFNLPLYFQAVLLESASKAGSRLLVPSVASTVGSTITGFVVSQTGRVAPSVYAGTSLIVLGSAGFCFIHRGMPSLLYTVTLIPANMGIGTFLPSQFMSLLGITYHHEQAVVSSTCFMWRSIGTVFGIAISSLIVQNGLVHYLDKYVTGSVTEKEEIIKLVRGSVTAVFKLDPVHQEEAIRAYESSLKLCFIFTVMTALVAAGLVSGNRMPNLKEKEETRVIARKTWQKKKVAQEE